ncbi:tyw1, partial [Symbiodinium microadriaticum]
AGVIHESMVSLGAVPLLEPVYGDDASNLQRMFMTWSAQLTTTVRTTLGAYEPNETADSGTPDNPKRGGRMKRLKGEKRKGKGGGSEAAQIQQKEEKQPPVAAEQEEPEEEDLINDTFVYASSDEEEEIGKSCGGSKKDGVGSDDEGVGDVEDLGSSISKGMEESKQVGREMVTKLQRKALTKEGYKIIGTHSAVKMCRWTKNQMRGRGGCYKHSFYGITSYQCMEATPSLACANKCVFCWRHHKNPVGTEWRWKTDEPEMIVAEAIREHQAMVNQMKGVPGVIPERYQEAFTVRHCALSLVGEPIMYPKINDMIQDLHSRKISTFLVTNAQFPEQIKTLHPCTQLYVSVDAATSESMKAVDRPLFKDFWARFKTSLAHMREKQQRTVYRMTLVKSYNMDEVRGYADLIEEGRPDFIEIKAVTYCGKSDAYSLTMKNVPWHHEVCAYAESIAQNLRDRHGSTAPVYSIATEHEHSCCVLLAREDKFKVDGVWHTWIDYRKFDQLIEEYYASNGDKTFSSCDYMAATPDWALYQSAERGFDPVENRWKRNKTGALVEIEYKSTDSGCG